MSLYTLDYIWLWLRIKTKKECLFKYTKSQMLIKEKYEDTY